jgi:hypothetical protein
VIGVGLVALAVALGVLANTRRDPAIGRHGSTSLGRGQPVGMGDALAAYRIDYRVEEHLSGTVRVSTQKLWVRRPFESRLERWSDAPPGRRLQSTNIATLGRTLLGQADAAALISEQPPAVAPLDIRLAPSLRAALHDGDLQRNERRRVAGRVCQVYRSKSRLIGDTIAAPTTKSFVDTCIDRDGLVLEEVQFTAGRRQSRQLAVHVDTRPRLNDDLFAIAKATLDVMHGGGSTRPVDPASSPPGQFQQLDAPPAGFTLLGRFSVVPPQPENFSDPLREDFRRAGVSDVFVRGADVVIVERGGTLRNQAPWAVDAANATIDLGTLGKGEIVLGGRSAEVRVLTGGGHYVRVFGTLPPNDLAAIARQLHPVPGGQLKFLD